MQDESAWDVNDDLLLLAAVSLGFRLQQAGQHVTVIERDQLGHGASCAAAGYLEPPLGDNPAVQAEWQSPGMWPEFVTDVQNCSGRDTDYQNNGQLRISYADNEAEIHRDYEARKAAGWEISSLSAGQAHQLEPTLSHDIVGASLLSAGALG